MSPANRSRVAGAVLLVGAPVIAIAAVVFVTACWFSLVFAGLSGDLDIEIG
jgi:hypothetical protein